MGGMRPSDQHRSEGIRQRHTSQARKQFLGDNKRGWSYPLSLTTSASIHEKAGAKAPARNQLQTNPEAGTQTRDGRERRWPSKERKRTTKTHRDGRHRKERERTQKPGTDQPPGQQTPEPQHGSGRTRRRPSASYAYNNVYNVAKIIILRCKIII